MAINQLQFQVKELKIGEKKLWLGKKPRDPCRTCVEVINAIRFWNMFLKTLIFYAEIRRPTEDDRINLNARRNTLVQKWVPQLIIKVLVRLCHKTLSDDNFNWFQTVKTLALKITS